MNKNKIAVITAILITGSITSSAEEETLVIIGTKDDAISMNKTTPSATSPDVGDSVQQLPGAAINRNGPVTPVAQYRGMFGDRININVSGGPTTSAGPNAMDAPLTYAPKAKTQSIEVFRGIAPVSAGINTLGGSISVNSYQPELLKNESRQWKNEGELYTAYSNNGSSLSTGIWNNVANEKNALWGYGDFQKASANFESGDSDKVDPSYFEKSAFGAALKHGSEMNFFQFNADYFDTGRSGTPALPMDIKYVETYKFGINGQWMPSPHHHDQEGSTLQHGPGLKWMLGFTDADHIMDNFTDRDNGGLANRYRSARAKASALNWKVMYMQPFSTSKISIGFDGYTSWHETVITDPTNPMFNVTNFKNVEDDRTGLFAEWAKLNSKSDTTVGFRIKHAYANAGEVSHHMAQSSMGINNLLNSFNQADREVSVWNADFAVNHNYQFNDLLNLSISTGIKQRAPSYQERYLWLPMESTGGMADMQVYIGDIDLESETAYQIDAGFDWANNSFSLSPRLYYQYIDNFIQGIPSENTVANMVSQNMNSGRTPLQFSNVEAEIYGADLTWSYKTDSLFKVWGIAEYTVGHRKDINDNLYRIAPANMTTGFTLAKDQWFGELQWQLVADQNDISETNKEEKTSGYGLLHLQSGWEATSIQVMAGIENLLNRSYSNHLGAYNRVINSDLEVGERLPGKGRSAWLSLAYQW